MSECPDQKCGWRLISFLRAVWFVFTLGAIVNAATAAGVCTPTAGNIAHGSVDPSTGSSFNTSGTLNFSCSGYTSGQQVLMCISYGWTLNGLGSCTGFVRYLQSAAGGKYTNVFYKDAAYSIVWADNDCGSATAAFDPGFTINIGAGGTGSGSGTVYSQMLSGQQSVVPGTYTGDMGGDGARYFYRLKTGASDVCSSNVGTVANGPSFQMSVTVPAACTIIGVGNVDFGSASVLSANIDASSTLSVRCTSTTPYTIALDGGTSAAANPTLRKMVNGAQQITYGLYSDAARTTAWGNSAGATVAGTGSGSTQALTIYGRVPPQTSVPLGSYSDTVVVSVTY